MGQGRVLSTDPNAGAPLRTSGGAPRVLSTDPNAGEPLRLATKRGLVDRSTIDDFPVFNLAKGAWNVVSQVPGAVYEMAKDVAPYDAHGNLKFPLENTVRGIGEAQGRLGVEAKEAFDQGEYMRAARKGL